MRLAAVIFLPIFGVAFCEQVQSAPGTSASKPNQVASPAPTAVAPTTGAHDTLSIDYDYANDRKIILNVAKCFGIKVVIPEDFPTGSATIRLRDVTWRQVFQVVLSPIGYSFIEREDEVEIMTVQQIKNLPPERRQVKLHFQRPSDLAFYLKKVFKQRITVEETADGVVFSTHPSNTRMILQDIARVDRPNVSFERFIHPRKLYFPNAIPKNLPLPASLPEVIAQDPAFVSTVVVTEDVILLEWVECDPVKEIVERECPGLVKIVADERANALIITGTYAQLRKVTALVAYLDDKKWYELPEKQAKTSEPAAVTAPAAREAHQP